ncbi:MAG TPA: hypothetical protein VFB44_00095 [Thermoleophilaceae bacterium]|nr:hypothetical protein [Thermoleophilaceae bacterium]
MAALAVLGIFAITNALAVHDVVFQLDGDTDSATTTNVGGNIQAIDWDNFFDADGDEITPLPTGFDASSFTDDFRTNANGTFNTSDGTTFTTGSKDTLNINPGWQCASSANVTDKADIMNAYAASYVGTGDREILYMGLERNANNGDGNVGFWFLQDEVSCDSSAGTTTFTGNHVDGDLFIVSEFSGGGSVSTIQVYRWNGGAGGSLGTTPVAQGASCATAAVNDTVCAIVNGNTITTDWLTANKQDDVGNSLRVGEFFEAGLDLEAAGLGGKCFNTFLANTRSSTSLTATIFDFTTGTLGECTSDVATTPVDNATPPAPIPAGGLTIPADPADSALLVRDRAVLDVTGVDEFEATLTFHLCGPTAANSTALCDSGGVLIDTQNITADGTFTSAAATVTSAGRYCWRATFSGDEEAGVPPDSDSSATECFLVNPRTPTLTTQAGAPTVDFGQPVTDTATLTGTAHKPGTGGPAGSNGSINPATPGGDATGTITFTLYKADCTTLATGTGTNPQTRTVSGDGTYGPVSFTPDAPGTYHWVASYGGDPPNTNSTTHNNACNDPNEAVVVQQIPSAISTEQDVYPNDSATVSSTVASRELPAGGRIVFKLYDTVANCQANTNTGLLYTETDNTVGGGGAGNTASTNNTTVAVDADATVAWRVTYEPLNAAFTGRQSACVERTAIDFTDDAGPGTLFP